MPPVNMPPVYIIPPMRNYYPNPNQPRDGKRRRNTRVNNIEKRQYAQIKGHAKMAQLNAKIRNILRNAPDTFGNSTKAGHKLSFSLAVKEIAIPPGMTNPLQSKIHSKANWYKILNFWRNHNIPNSALKAMGILKHHNGNLRQTNNFNNFQKKRSNLRWQIIEKMGRRAHALNERNNPDLPDLIRYASIINPNMNLKVGSYSKNENAFFKGIGKRPRLGNKRFGN